MWRFIFSFDKFPAVTASTLPFRHPPKAACGCPCGGAGIVKIGHLRDPLTCRVPGEIRKRKVELDPQVSPEDVMEQGRRSWAAKLDFFRFGSYSTAVQRTLSL